jgi:hypothetical protein
VPPSPAGASRRWTHRSFRGPSGRHPRAWTRLRRPSSASQQVQPSVFPLFDSRRLRRLEPAKGTSAEAASGFTARTPRSGGPFRLTDALRSFGCQRCHCCARGSCATGSAAANSAGIALAAATEGWAARTGCRVTLLPTLAERTATTGRQRREAARRHCLLFDGLRAHRVHVGVIAAEEKQRFSVVSGYVFEGNGARNTSN